VFCGLEIEVMVRWKSALVGAECWASSLSDTADRVEGNC
jgi:hypothetical protein